MRASLPLTAILAALHLAAGSAPAQCIYYPPPPAPDMCSRGYCPSNPYGTPYGPYYVRPPFAPFQGMVSGPTVSQPGPGCSPYGGAMQMNANNPGGTMGFPSHQFARSPRDFFMIETDPRASPYNYGPYSSPRTGIDYP